MIAMEQIDAHKEKEPFGAHILPKGHLLNSRYKISSVLGEDAACIRYSAYDFFRSCTIAVCEFFPKELVSRSDASTYTAVACQNGAEAKFTDAKEGFLRNSELMSALSPGIGMAKVLESFSDNETVYAVYEYLNLPSLAEFVGGSKLSDAKTALALFRPVVYALSVMHDAGIAHGSVCADKLLVYSDEAVILSPDFTKVVLKEKDAEHFSDTQLTDVYELCRCILLSFTGELPSDGKVLPDSVLNGLNEEQKTALIHGVSKLKTDRPKSAAQLFSALYGVPANNAEMKRQAASPLSLSRSDADANDGQSPYPQQNGGKKRFIAILIASTVLVAALAVFALYRFVLSRNDPLPASSAQSTPVTEVSAPALPAAPEALPSPSPSVVEPSPVPLIHGTGWVLDRSSKTLTVKSSYIPEDFSADDYYYRPWQSYVRQIETLVCEDGVERIGDRAFQECTFLKEVQLPSSLRTIGRNSFSDCVKLRALDLPEGMIEIGEGAFLGCSSLERVCIPKSMQTIGWYAFSGCDEFCEVSYAGSEEEFGSIKIGRVNDILKVENVFFEGE